MRNEDNTFSGSYRELAEDIRVSLPTVSFVMKELIDANVIKKIRTGTYTFNPSIIIKGGSDKRKNLLVKYNYVDDEKKQVSNAKMVDAVPKDQTYLDVTEEGDFEIKTPE